METDNAGFSPRQSLELIESMINQAKDRFNENGHLYLLWGWTVLICTTAEFVLLHFFQYPNHYVVWFLSWGIIIYQVFYLYRKRKNSKVRTYADAIIGYVWLTFCVLLFLIAFFLGQVLGGQYYQSIFPVILVLYGMPTFLSGIILRFKPLIIGGISCWILSLIAAMVYYDYQLLFLAAAVIIAWIIPGYTLRAKFKKQTN
jgi:cation transport ATPase